MVLAISLSTNQNQASKSNSSSESSQFLQAYINFGYYVGACPFKITNSAEIQRNYFQMVCCGILSCMGALVRIYYLQGLQIFAKSAGNLHPLDYFEAAEHISLFVYYIAILVVWWSRCGALRKVILLLREVQRSKNFIRKSKRGIFKTVTKNWTATARGYISGKLKITLWLILTTVFFILYYLTKMSSTFATCSYNLNSFLSFMETEGRTFLFVPPRSSENLPISNNTRDVLSSVFICVNILSHFGETLIMAIGDMLLISLSVVFFNYISDFGKRLNDTYAFHIQTTPAVAARPLSKISKSTYNSSAIFEEFDQIKRLGDKINRAVGVLEFALTLGSVPFFTANFIRFLSPQNIWLFLNVVLCFTTLMTFMTMAARVNKRAQVLEQWLSCRRNYLKMRRSGSNALGIGEVLAVHAGRYIGFNGAGLFVFTMKFLGAWICLVLTFAVIMIQMKEV